MVNQEKISSYMNSLLYSVSRPRICEVVTSSLDFDGLSKADTEANLLTLGALLATGKFNEFAQLTQQLDFSNIPPDDRSYLANTIFTVFSDCILAKSEASSDISGAILQLLIALSPEVVLAHKLKCEPLKQNELIELDYAQNINASVTGNVFFREFQFGPGSRKCEFGYRIQSSLASNGWDVPLLPLQDLLHYSSPYQKDFVLIDILAFWQMPPLDYICRILSQLKRYFRKIIIIEPDPWTGLYDDMLRAVSDHIH
ncbi:MAG: hypothetical protein PHH28_09615, partial [Desulfuromonadaceae bacterium]|nr:hypothetical protein [Desulfuromonadaceae bacterium]